MFQSYSKKQLNNIARDNYEILRNYCATLEREGYWDGPRSILKQSIFAILDMYLQTVLIRLAVYCKCFGLEEKRFIADIPDINIYGLDPEAGDDSQILESTEKFFDSPPILLQLCGLRDINKKSGMLGLFFDALLNVQLSMAFLNSSESNTVAGFIHEYYSKVEAFLGNGKEYGAVINERYIFKKLCDDNLEKSAGNLKSAGDSFKVYADTCLFLGSRREEIALARKVVPEENRETLAIRKIIKTDEEEKITLKSDSELDRLLKELNSLIGLVGVKEEVNSLINLIKVRALRKKHNLPLMDMSFHMVFTGNPGTGKTTVARLIAGIYKELGLLSKGQLIETDKSGLVAGYVGQTAIKVREVVEKALGGVLFIDEAYSLSSQGMNDFGDEAIETLVKMMEDHRDNLVVIVAGYRDEMKSFLKSNTGLQSRFNKFIEFKDYSDEELIKILFCMAEKAGFCISDSAERKAAELVENMSAEEKAAFGNARGIRNMFERIVVNQANRVSRIEEPDINALTSITDDDVR